LADIKPNDSKFEKRVELPHKQYTLHSRHP